MENEDYRIITLHDNKLKVYRDGRIEKEHIYKCKTKGGNNKGDIKWRNMKGGIRKNTGYMRICLTNQTIKKDFSTHRIMGYTFLGLDIDNPKEMIDHINGNKKDNTFMNLRIVSSQQNSFNRKTTKGCTWDKSRNNWISSIKINNKSINLGRYKTEAAARYAYLVAKNHYHQF